VRIDTSKSDPHAYIEFKRKRTELIPVLAPHRSSETTMMTRIAATAAAVVLGVASISSAMAAERPSRYVSFGSQIEATGSINTDPQAPAPFGCPMSSAAEGNANQQNFPVQQYGQTSGGNRC